MAAGRMTGESERGALIEGFVRRFLASSGAEVTEEGAVLTARLPRELAAELGTGERLMLSFRPGGGSPGPGGASEGEEPEYVAPGHPLLDRMLEVAKGRGFAASLLLAPALDPEFVRYALSYRAFGPGESAPEPAPGLARSLRRELASASFVNARVQVRTSRLVHQAQMLFRFKVAFVSDEKRESIVTLLVDPVTEEVDRPLDLGRAVSFSPRGAGSGAGAGDYAPARLYRRAEEHLRARLEPIARAFESEAAARCERELARIEEYYRGLFEERLESMRGLFRRVSAAGVRAELARTWQSQERYRDEVERLRAEARELERVYKDDLEELRREREQRILEVKEKHAARVEVSLLQGAYVLVPRVEWTLRLDGPARREATVLYDVLRRKLVDFACESCGGSFAGGVYLCGCEGLLCRNCHFSCPRCGKSLCPLCSRLRCHVCGRLLCDRCDASCPLGKAYPALPLPAVCPECREAACPGCVASSGAFALEPF